MSGSVWVARTRVIVLTVVAATVTALVASAGMASASVATHRQTRVAGRPASKSGLSLAHAPAALRAAVRRTLGVHASTAGGVSQQAEWTGGASNYYFGYSVAVDGSTAVVGAEGANSDAGAAYVFVKSGGKWSEETELTAAGGAAGDQFGVSVAISGSTIVVGADYAYSGAGAAYVFVESGSTWPEQAELIAPGTNTNDAFGYSVAASGSTVVVGAPDANSGAGETWVYTPSGSTWSEQAALTGPTGAVVFGYSVAASGSTVVVGAQGTDSGAGAVYVFAPSGATWVQQDALTDPDDIAGDVFGSAVAISGYTLVVGATGADSGAGAAYVFEGSGSTWNQKAELKGSAVDDGFGWSVATSGSMLVVGAEAANSDTGAAYMYVQSGSSWLKRGELTGGGKDDFFGNYVAISGSTALVGEPDINSATGATYVYTIAANSAISLKLSASKVTFGRETTEHLSVQVRSSYSGAVTGKVTITAKPKKGKAVKLCVITIKSGKGSCKLSAKALKAGTYKLTATYGGTTNVITSTSPNETLTVRK